MLVPGWLQFTISWFRSLIGGYSVDRNFIFWYYSHFYTLARLTAIYNIMIFVSALFLHYFPAFWIKNIAQEFFVNFWKLLLTKRITNDIITGLSEIIVSKEETIWKFIRKIKITVDRWLITQYSNQVAETEPTKSWDRCFWKRSERLKKLKKVLDRAEEMW